MNISKQKNKIVIFIGHFLPGNKSGGPVQTIFNIVNAFKEKNDFFIVCGDRDIGDTHPYDNIVKNTWSSNYGAQIFYTDINGLSMASLKELCRDADLILCCGTYDNYSIRLAKLAKRKHIKNLHILSMGNFSQAALKIKKIKKRCFWLLARISKLFNKVTWCFSSAREYQDALKVLKRIKKYHIMSDIPRLPIDVFKETNEGPLRIVFLSRIVKIKNLDKAIRVLERVNFDFVFDIYGPIQDCDYWEKCKMKLQKTMNGKWSYKGEIDSNDVIDVFSNYDIFLFFSFGENFGHVIYESLLSGCVPLISNNTPWNEEDGVFVFDDEDVNGPSSKIIEFNFNRSYLLTCQKKCQLLAKEKYKHIISESIFNNY